MSFQPPPLGPAAPPYPPPPPPPGGPDPFSPLPPRPPFPEGSENQFTNRFPDYREDETLGGFLIRRAKSAVHGLWKRSHTVARIDLIRPSFYLEDYKINRENNRDLYANERNRSVPPQSQAPATPGTYFRPPYSNVNSLYPSLDQPPTFGTPSYPSLSQQFLSPSSPLPPPPSPPRKWYEVLTSVHGVNRRGARLKLMQVWNLVDEENEKPFIPKSLNFGVGFNFDMDRGILEPKLRLRTKSFVLHFLPHSDVELRKRIQIGSSNLAIDIRYKMPLDSSKKNFIGEGGGLRVHLFNPIGTGLHLSPRGLEFDEQVIRLGKSTGIRLACWLGFARQIPLRESETLFDLNVSRLGIKTKLS